MIGCSKSSPTVKPESSTNPVISDDTNRTESQIPPDEMPVVDIIMYQFIDVSVDNFYYTNGRVPENFNELKASGLLLGIPRCPHDQEFYHEVSNLTDNDPSGFVYISNSDKSYVFSYLTKENDIYKTITTERLDDIWESKFYTGKAEFLDAKIQALMSFFDNAAYLYVRENSDFPNNAKELMANYSLVTDAWQASEDAKNTAFDCGVDTAHGRFFMRYKYSHGASGFGVMDSDYFSSNDIETKQQHSRGLKYDDTPASDYLVPDVWCDLNSLNEFYNICNN